MESRRKERIDGRGRNKMHRVLGSFIFGGWEQHQELRVKRLKGIQFAAMQMLRGGKHGG